MHTLLDLIGTFTVIFLSGRGLLAFLRHQTDWVQRRHTQALILMLPLASFIVVLMGLHHIVESTCSDPDPFWDHTLDITFISLICMVFISAALLGMLRLVLLKRSIMRQELLLDPALQAQTNAFAALHGIAPVRLRLSHANYPVALIYGLQHPTILLSTWMKEHLDEQELEAVLAHELGHLIHRDYLTNWLAIMLRDAFFFLPTSRIAYHQFCYEKELACDDWVAQVTRRPLALASALTKVWLNRVENSTVGIQQQLSGANTPVVDRVERLLGWKGITQTEKQGHIFTGLRGILVPLLLLNTLIFTLLFAVLLMNC